MSRSAMSATCRRSPSRLPTPTRAVRPSPRSAPASSTVDDPSADDPTAHDPNTDDPRSSMTWPNAAEILPDDAESATLVGRAWVPAVAGPSVVVLRGAEVVDVSAAFATMRALTESPDPATAATSAAAFGTLLGTLDELVANTPPETRDTQRPWLLSPIDLQVVKAAG